MIKPPILLGVLALSGCLELPDPDDGTVSQDVDSTNGRSLNGTSLNGTSLNGKSLNGKSLNGTSLNGKSLNGTTLTASSTTAPPITGASMVGSTWTGTASDGTTIPLRVDSATQGAGGNADLWFYGVSYQTTTGWAPICGVDANKVPIQAVPVAGAWMTTTTDTAFYQANATKFTFACRGNSIAKCVELGYKTYKGFTNQLLSCVRLLRADYCGTGTPHTVDGTLLNLYDNVGVQLDTEAWHPEAAWGPKGATCMNTNNLGRYKLAQQNEPLCAVAVQSATCGTSFPSGTYLIDELP